HCCPARLGATRVKAESNLQAAVLGKQTGAGRWAAAGLNPLDPSGGSLMPKPMQPALGQSRSLTAHLPQISSQSFFVSALSDIGLFRLQPQLWCVSLAVQKVLGWHWELYWESGKGVSSSLNLSMSTCTVKMPGSLPVSL